MKGKTKSGALLGAAFLMATSAIGPGFLTQTAKFTGDFKGSFGFVILLSVLLSIVAQLNIWRVLCVSGLRGQEVGNRLLPGLGYFISFLIVLGGLVFNIGISLPAVLPCWFSFPKMRRESWISWLRFWAVL